MNAPDPAPERRGVPSILGRVASGAVRVWEAIALGLTRFGKAGLGFLWPFLAGAIGLGSAIWFFKHKERAPELLTNKIPYDQQLSIARYVGQGFAAITLALVIALVVMRVRTGRFQFARTASRVGAFAVPLAGLPFVSALFVPSIEGGHAVLTLVYCALFAVIVGVGVYRALGPAKGFEPHAPDTSPTAEAAALVRKARWDRVGKWAAFLALVAMCAGYGAFFSHLAITNHHGLATRTTDLGYYDNIFYQSIHGHFLGCSFIKAGYHGSAHFDPILVVLSPLYLFYPRAEFLLVFQSVWLGSGVFPVYLIARRFELGRLASLAIAACFVLHPAVHGANMYEFHSLTLAIVPLLWVVYAFEARRLKLLFLVVPIALLTREDISLMLCFVAMSAMFRFADARRRAGFAVIIASLAWFAATKIWFMTSSSVFQAGPEAYSYAYYYEELTPNSKGFGGMVLSLMTNPAFLVDHVFEEAKMVFLLTIFLPMAFLPFVARSGRFTLFYGLFFTLLASRTAVFSTHFQYIATIVPFAFALVPAGIARLRDSATIARLGLSPDRVAKAFVAAMLVASLVVTAKFGGFVENASFRGGFNRVTRSLTAQDIETYNWVAKTADSIPKAASVHVTDKMGPHVSNRMNAFFVGDKHPADYIFVDEKELKGDRQKTITADVKRGALVEIARRQSIVLYRTKDPNAERPESNTPPTTPPEQGLDEETRDREKQEQPEKPEKPSRAVVKPKE